DVEAARAPGEAIAREIVEGQQRHATTLEAGDGVDRPAELPPHARLDLDEHDGRAVARDDVQFATPQAIAAGNNCVPATFELATREILADFTERLPGTRHHAHSQQESNHEDMKDTKALRTTAAHPLRHQDTSPR